MQLSLRATRERPQTHLPPSPSAPMRSISCGQLKAAGKKSQAVYGGQGSLSGGNLHERRSQHPHL